METEIDHRRTVYRCRRRRSPLQAIAMLWLIFFGLLIVLPAQDAVAQSGLGQSGATAISQDRGHAAALTKRDAFRLLSSVDRSSASKGKIDTSSALPAEDFDLKRDSAAGVLCPLCSDFARLNTSAAYDPRGPPASAT